MKKKLLLAAILVISFFLRTCDLSTNPPAAYGDELSFAWNAWNILKLGTDEYGNPYPLQFRAFEDYKAPIPVYLLVPVLKILGMNTYSVRLPVAVFGVMTIFIFYLLVRKMINDKLALLAAFLFAVSPWHLHLSRGYFESTIALFFLVAAVYFFILGKEKTGYFYLSAIFFASVLYTYFTPRIMLLLFIPFLIWWGKDWIFKNKKALLGFIMIISILCLPLIYVSFFEKGLSRINKLVSTRNSIIERQVVENITPYHDSKIVHRVFHNKLWYWTREITNSYLEHFSVNFWYLYGDSSLRYFLGNMGMFYIAELPFLIMGIWYLFKKYRRIFWLIIGWLLIAPVPAAISGKPYAVRSLAMLPPALLFPAGGLIFVWNYLKTVKIFHQPVKIIIIIFFCSCFGYYFVRYHQEYPIYAATWWGWENKAAIDLARQNQDKYERIFISNFYSGMDLALAYYLNYDPAAYKKAKENPVILADDRHFIRMGKFYIGSLDIDNRRMDQNIMPPNSLYIARPEEADSHETINAPSDGRIIFKIYRKD